MRVVDFVDGFETSSAPGSSTAWTAPDGTSSLPGISWNSDTDTGFYRVGNNNFAAVCGTTPIVWYSATGVRIHNNASVKFATERASVWNVPLTGDAATNQGALAVSHYNQRDTAFSGQQNTFYSSWERVITASVTDTSSVAADMWSAVKFSIGSGATYTYAGDLCGYYVEPPSNAGPGSLAIGVYAGLFVDASSLNTGTRKIGLYVGAQSGATYNCFISDSKVFTDNFGIYLGSSNKNFLGGPLGIEAGVGTDTMFRVRGNAGISGANQYGAYLDTICSTSATSSFYGVTSAPQTPNSSFTCGLLASYVANAQKGAASTVTRYAGWFFQKNFVGANNAILTDSSAYSGDWGIYLTETSPSLITGPICYGVSTVASASSITGMSAAASIVRLTGSTATTIHGIAAGRAGQLLIIHNPTGANLTIANESGTEGTAANRITTLTGSDVASTTNSAHQFYYDSNSSRWVYLGGQV